MLSIRASCAFWVPLVLLAATTQELLHQAEAYVEREQFSLAEPVLKNALRLEPSNVQALHRLGYVQYRQRNLAEAKKNFSSALNLAPPAYHSRYFLGRIAMLENDPAEAISWLQPVFDSRQQIFDTASQLAAAYAAAGQTEKALGPLQIAIAEAPWDGALYYRLGQIYLRKGQREIAQEAFDNSRRLKNATREDVEILMQTSRLIGEGKKAEGVQAGAQIINRSSPDPNSLVALGVVYGTNNLQREALDAFERAAALDASLFQAHYNRGLALLKLNRTAEALPSLARAVELLPQSVEANVTYGLAGVMSQRYTEAVAPLEQARKLNSSNARVDALLATAYLRIGQPAKAVSVLQTDSLRSSVDPAPTLLLVEALNATNSPEKALSAAVDARTRFPQSPQAQLAVAQQLARMGRYQEAKPSFEEVLRLIPGNPEAELGLADTYQKAGDHPAALTHYPPAIENPRTSVAARAGMARSLIALRRLEESRKLLEDGISLYPADPALRVELSRVYARLGKPDLAAEQTRMVEKLRSEQN
ncbi:MAG TPA: tetratricopeptide repeat protein [Bryobacteraceae bacterium]|nr:tetratricopeptide repeat protein [Bryobacteraceae bacterium]